MRVVVGLLVLAVLILAAVALRLNHEVNELQDSSQSRQVAQGNNRVAIDDLQREIDFLERLSR